MNTAKTSKENATLYGLYAKAMRQFSGSPAQKKTREQIDKLRMELGLDTD